MFWKKKEKHCVFYVSGKEIQPQHIGEMAVVVACQAYPNFIKKLQNYSDTTRTPDKSMYQILINERWQYLSAHFHSFIASIFFAYSHEIAKVPEPIYLRIAAGMVTKLPEILSILGRQFTDDDIHSFSSSVAKYASLVFSDPNSTSNPASMLCANFLFNAAADYIPEDEDFPVAEVAILPKLLDAELHECIEAIKKLDLRYEEH